MKCTACKQTVYVPEQKFISVGKQGSKVKHEVCYNEPVNNNVKSFIEAKEEFLLRASRKKLRAN